MRRTWMQAISGVAAAVAIGWAPVLSGGLAAQEQEQEQQAAGAECELQPSPAVNSAAQSLQMAQNAQNEEDRRAAYENAVDALGPTLAEDGAEGTPYLLAAQARVGLGEYERADSLLNVFLEKSPECTEHADNTRYNAWVELYNQGIQAYQQGEAEQALDRFEAANLIYDDPRSYNNAAILHQQQGDTDRAIELYRQAVQAEEGDPEQVRQALSSLGELLLAEGQTEEAVNVYRDYLEDNPEDMVARVDYGLALREAGQADSAAAIFAELRERPADELTAEQWVRAGVGLYRAEEYEGAVEAFQKARERNPYHKEAMENLVSAATQTEAAGEVVGVADTLVQWYPYDEQNYNALATVLSRTQDNARALQTLQEIEGAPFAFQNLQMQQANETTWVVQGEVTAREGGAEQSYTIPFEFVGPDGQVVATEQLTLQAPASGETQPFTVEVTSEQPIAGFRYDRSQTEESGD